MHESTRWTPRPPAARAGIGLRFQHHQAMLQRRPPVGWLEVHAENYFGGGAPLACLEALRPDYSISLHGVGASLGSTSGIDAVHLERLRALTERIAPAIVSEHLCWSVTEGTYFADLLPLPMTEEALAVVCRNVARVQDALHRPVAVENISAYIRYRHSTIPEPEFLAALAARTGCGILCDVANIYVNARNHGEDPLAYLAALPAPAIDEIHLAGHAERCQGDGSTLLIDDHGSRVPGAVWQLYASALARFGPCPSLIEWDNEVPALDVLLDEAAKATFLLQTADNAHDRARAA